LKYLFSIIILFSFQDYLEAQSSWYRTNRIIEQRVDQIDIQDTIVHDLHTSIKPYYREDVLAMSVGHNSSSSNYIKTDNYFADEQIKETGFWNHFYKSPAHFLEFSSEDFKISINPIIHFSTGRTSDDTDLIFQNTRGLELYGSLDNKIYFSSSVFENQRHFLNHIDKRIARDKAIPGNGFFKLYTSGISDNIFGWDYLNAQGYVGFNISKSVSLEFGHGKHFIGNGYHSLLLDNYGHNYFYLKFNTRFWKFHYQNIFAELSIFGSEDNISNTLLPKKYMAAHFLDINLTNNFSIGIYEAIIFNRENHFEFNYLNPIILYRSVEQFLDSPDNVLIGLNFKWNIYNRIQAYSQILIDELVIGELTNNNGWWGNKYGIQLGLKYMSIAGIENLDGQLEYNLVRPYTYAHQDTIEGLGERAIASYSHYNQPLAHALGSNFSEFLWRLRYQIGPKFTAETVVFFTTYGEDINGLNYGGNILKTYETRITDYDNSTGQGNKQNIRQLKFELSYQLFHNGFIDIDYFHRSEKFENLDNNRQSNYIGLGFRMNIARQRLDY